MSAASWAAAAEPRPAPCASTAKDALAGTPAVEGTAYQLGDGLEVLAPAVPAGWMVSRCHAGQVVFVKADEAQQFLVTAIVTRAPVDPWRDEQHFAGEIRAMFLRASGAGDQHLTTDAVTATTVAGRHCVELRRSGTASDKPSVDLAVPDPWIAREFVRACHPGDAASAPSAVLAIVKLTGFRDPGTLDTMARAFVAGVTLPPAR